MTRPLKIVVAPDSFKGSLTATQVCAAAEEGLCRVWPDAEIVCVPMADGGEGTVQSLVEATGGEIIDVDVTGPLGEMVSAFFGILGDRKTAAIEMAAASGLPLVSADRRNPMITTTRGTGELIAAALDEGCRRFIIGIGGSATNDGGAGMAQALGARLLDAGGKDIGPGGAELARLVKIDVSRMDRRLAGAEFVVATDVDNPLTGPDGASAVYGPQKGATPEMVHMLNAALGNYAAVIRRDLRVDVEGMPGAGAAGGLGAGLVAFLGARLQPGVEIVINATGLKDKIAGADLVITGEGRIDFQTLYGKTPMGVARVAGECGVPVAMLAGSVANDARGLYDHGVDALMTVVKGPCTLDTAIARAYVNVTDAAETMARLVDIGKRWQGGAGGRPTATGR